MVDAVPKRCLEHPHDPHPLTSTVQARNRARGDPSARRVCWTPRSSRIDGNVVVPSTGAHGLDHGHVHVAARLESECVFGLQPLTSAEANAYDYSNSFNHRRRRSPRCRLCTRAFPPRKRAWAAP